MTVDATSRRKRTRLWVLLIAAALVAGGGIAAVVGVNAYSAETARLCDAALENAKAAHDASQAAVASADEALTAVESTVLPDGGTSTAYADRPAAEATNKLEARPSGAKLIEGVSARRDALATANATAQCNDRDQAERIASGSEKASADVDALEEATAALLADFGQFQADEAARLAAEKKAAEEAAAAAQAEAERIAAEEAARQAEQNYTYDPGYSGGGSDGNGGGNSGGSGGNSGGSSGGGGGTQIAPPPGQSGGGCPPDKPVCYG